MMRSPGLVATQTLTFLSTGIEDWTAMGQRLGGAHAGVLAGPHWLIRAGLAGYGGGKAGPWGDGVIAVSASPGPHRPVAVARGS